MCLSARVPVACGVVSTCVGRSGGVISASGVPTGGVIHAGCPGVQRPVPGWQRWPVIGRPSSPRLTAQQYGLPVLGSLRLPSPPRRPSCPRRCRRCTGATPSHRIVFRNTCVTAALGEPARRDTPPRPVIVKRHPGPTSRPLTAGLYPDSDPLPHGGGWSVVATRHLAPDARIRGNSVKASVLHDGIQLMTLRSKRRTLPMLPGSVQMLAGLGKIRVTSRAGCNYGNVIRLGS